MPYIPFMKEALAENSNANRVHFKALLRLQKIHALIAGQKYPSVENLAEALQVNRRTVKRDIAAFRDRFQAPLAYDKKRKGYFYTHHNWELPIASLEDTELFAFFVTVLLLQAKGQVYQDAKLQKALAKIASRLPEEIYVNLSYLLENISVQEIPHVFVRAEILDLLTACATEKRTVEFDYYSPHSRETKHRKANVLLLHNHEGDWYAIAFDHLRRQIRDFHVGRMSDLTETKEFFSPPKSWNRQKYLNGGFGMFRGGRPTEVEIVFEPFQAQWIKERQFFHPNETREELPDGSLRLNFQVGEKGLEAVARFCLKYAGSCRAVRPGKLREIIREKLQKALEEHL